MYVCPCHVLSVSDEQLSAHRGRAALGARRSRRRSPINRVNMQHPRQRERWWHASRRMRILTSIVLLSVQRGKALTCEAWCNQWTCNMNTCIDCAQEKGCAAKPPPPPRHPPRPAMPPFDYAGISPGAIHFEGREGILFGNGEPFDIKGVNWFGSENRAGPPLGLDKHEIAWYMKWLKDNKFNAIRLLFNHQMVLSNAPLEPPNEVVYGAGAPWEAPELAHMSYLEMFDKIAEVAADHGILILMAAHRLGPTDWPGNGLWYNTVITEDLVLESWRTLAEKLCGRWNVFAVDLQNEPHSSSWGKGDERTDWGHGAERLGDHVLDHCARWLIFVEGVGFTPGARGYDNAGAGIWWGENLVGAGEQPVSLKDNSKLVYSPHTYGPSVYEQYYFSDANFPNNMAQIWTERFEFLRTATGSPVVIGEMGGHYVGKDKTWQDWAAAFMRQKQIGIFYFTLLVGAGASNDDTGGLLKEDWTTPEAEKLKMLSTIPSTDVLELKQRTSPPPPVAPKPPPPPSVSLKEPPSPLILGTSLDTRYFPPPPTRPWPSPPEPSPTPRSPPQPLEPSVSPPPPRPPPLPPPPRPGIAYIKDAAIRGSTRETSSSRMPSDATSQVIMVVLGVVILLSCAGICVLVRRLVTEEAQSTARSTSNKKWAKKNRTNRKPSRAERGQRVATEEPQDEDV